MVMWGCTASRTLCYKSLCPQPPPASLPLGAAYSRFKPFILALWRMDAVTVACCDCFCSSAAFFLLLRLLSLVSDDRCLPWRPLQGQDRVGAAVGRGARTPHSPRPSQTPKLAHLLSLYDTLPPPHTPPPPPAAIACARDFGHGAHPHRLHPGLAAAVCRSKRHLHSEAPGHDVGCGRLFARTVSHRALCRRRSWHGRIRRPADGARSFVLGRAAVPLCHPRGLWRAGGGTGGGGVDLGLVADLKAHRTPRGVHSGVLNDSSYRAGHGRMKCTPRAQGGPWAGGLSGHAHGAHRARSWDVGGGGGCLPPMSCATARDMGSCGAGGWAASECSRARHPRSAAGGH